MGFTWSNSDQVCKRTWLTGTTCSEGDARNDDETWRRRPVLDKSTWTITKTTRSDWKTAAHNRDIKTDITEETTATTTCHGTATVTTGHSKTTETSTTASSTSRPDADIIFEVLRLKLKESAKRREREAWCRSQVWCLSKAWCPNQALCPNEKFHPT